MPKINPRISSLDDLLGVAREVENTAAAEDKPAQPGNNEIQMLSPEIIRGFRGHPFRLYEGERLNDLVESISENGVLVPAIVTHDIENALREAKHILCVDRAGCFYGTVDEFLSSPAGKRFGGDRA